jgi:hypothetical protein
VAIATLGNKILIVARELKTTSSIAKFFGVSSTVDAVKNSIRQSLDFANIVIYL